MKKRALALLSLGITLLLNITAFAGEWRQEDNGEKYRNDDGYFYAGSWQWIDKDGNGMSECYRFDDDCYIMKDTTVDGHK